MTMTKKPMTHAGTVRYMNKSTEVQLRETPTRYYTASGYAYWPKKVDRYSDRRCVFQQGTASSYCGKTLDLDSIRPLTVEERRTVLSDMVAGVTGKVKRLEAEMAEVQVRMDQELKALRDARAALSSFDRENFNND